MADTKISALTGKATPIAADTIPIIDSVGGTNQKTTLGALPVSTPVETRLGGANAPSATEFTYVKGLTSPGQTQLSNLLTATTDPTSINPGHSHIVSAIDTTGTADALIGIYVPAIAALTDGMEVILVSAFANATTTPTFQYNDLTAHTIVKGANTALVAGDIPEAGYSCHFRYRLATTSWVLLNPAKIANANVIGLGGAALLAVGTSAGTVAAGDDARLGYVTAPTTSAQGVGTGNSPTFTGLTATNLIGTSLVVKTSHVQYTAAVGDDRHGGIKRYGVVTGPNSLGTGSSYTFTGIIPAGCVLEGITARVTTAIAGATSWSIGTAAAPTLWGSTLPVDVGTGIDMTNYLDGTAVGIFYKAAGDVVITANGGNFTAGWIKVSVFYRIMVKPSTNG